MVGVVTSLALAVGCAGAAAVEASRTQHASDMGSVAVTVVFGRHDTGAVVTAFHASGKARDPVGQRIESKDVRPSDNRFRFALKPGRYEIQDQLTKNSTPVGCRTDYAVSVRANDTTHIRLDLGFLDGHCGNTYSTRSATPKRS